ncbi:sulfatase [Actinoplanes sp. NEAU-A12]|uniref:Sulfatase n=1 Tax=Actinoplanes sandaracinus TaxID=3045177 RepID=A0ABT6WPZ0_9ACTN|nr:sulfatase [Actinoplanes sandaracinus]MDI6101705.1 sulfatase [Actinoplanes sandaracinus]
MSLITRLHRSPAPEPTSAADRDRSARRRLPIRTGLAGLLVFAVLAVPDNPDAFASLRQALISLLRLPLEGILGAAVLLATPARARRTVAIALGAALGVLGILKVINAGFREVLGRRFNPVLDWSLLGDGYNYLVETSSRAAAIGAVIGIVVVSVAAVAVIAVAVRHLAGVTARHHRPARRAVAALVPVWAVLALLSGHTVVGVPRSSDNVAVLVRNTVLGVPTALADRAKFAELAQADAFRNVPADQLLGGLRGHDVVIGVVESYGRTALQDEPMASIVGPALADRQRQLTEAGFSARSAFLTSSTYGGSSWLAHATFQSGVWIDNPDRYRQLVSGDRLTLTKAFQTAGWDTVGIEPGNTKAWPEAEFYGYDRVWDARNLGYQGPRFGWSRIPDQFTLGAFQKHAFAGRQKPMMAEVSLTSSHTPWPPTPPLVDWNTLGDGTIYGPIAQAGEQSERAGAPVQVRFAESVVYSIDSLLSWARTYADDDLVLIVFGDHQPNARVSGKGSDHDVPISIIAKDPSVFDKIADWKWHEGLKPGADAPLWKMDAFRDRFLTAFGTPGGAAR